MLVLLKNYLNYYYIKIVYIIFISLYYIKIVFSNAFLRNIIDFYFCKKIIFFHNI